MRDAPSVHHAFPERRPVVDQSELSTEWVLVTDERGVEQAAAQLAEGDGPAGVDAERASGFRYRDDAYLIQMHRRNAGTFLFDPTLISSWEPVIEAVGDEEWILHAASQDIPSLDQLGLRPQHLFDTELAARLLGFERVGLASIVEELLGITLQKAHSAADWSKRPLPESWLEYAALDVVLLPDLREAVAAELTAQGKVEIARQEFEFTRTMPPREVPADRWRKVSGGHKLRSPRELAIVRELWLARDDLAQSSDIAPGRLVPDSSLVAAAAAAPRSKRDLAKLQTFRGRASRAELDRWWDAILRGKTTEDLPGRTPRDPNAIPHHRSWAQRHPEAAARLTAARTLLEHEAESLGMPLENLLTPRLLRRLAWDPPVEPTVEAVSAALEALGARPWQCVRTAPLISSVFVELA